NQEPTEARVRIADFALLERAQDAGNDAHPILPEEAEQDERGRQVSGDEEVEEKRVLLIEVPTEQFRDDDRVAETGNRKELGDSLKESQDDCLPIIDQCRPPEPQPQGSVSVRQGIEPVPHLWA